MFSLTLFFVFIAFPVLRIPNSAWRYALHVAASPTSSVSEEVNVSAWWPEVPEEKDLPHQAVTWK